MKNTLADLSNHLFAQLERLSDEALDPEALTQEIRRAGAIDRIAAQVISVGALAVNAARLQGDLQPGQTPPRLLGLDGGQ
mgnify:FL=1|jgi:hypothetical protein